MRTNKAFSDAKTYEEFLNIFKDNIEYAESGYMNREALRFALPLMQSLDDKTQDEYLRYIKKVDENISAPMTANLYHKMPLLLSSVIYFSEHKEKIADLSFDELVTLARHSITQPLTFYEKSVEYFTRPLLTTIVNKTKNYMDRETLMSWSDEQISEVREPSDISKYISDTDENELQRKIIEFEEKAIQKAGEYL